MILAVERKTDGGWCVALGLLADAISELRVFSWSTDKAKSWDAVPSGIRGRLILPTACC